MSAAFLPLHLIKLLCCKGQLCYNVLLILGVTEEGIVGYGDLHAVLGLEVAVIVLDMKSVLTAGKALCAVLLPSVLALDDKAVFGVVRECAVA